jgi:hydrogenase nickel incorporation protein HypA/HybF
MHEFAIAQSMVDVAVSEAARYKTRRVTVIRCRVGVLRQVVPDMLRSAFEIAADQTLAAGAKVEIEKEPVRFVCRQCGVNGESMDWQCSCPTCGTFAVAISGGNDLLITEMELETDDEDTNAA